MKKAWSSIGTLSYLKTTIAWPLSVSTNPSSLHFTFKKQDRLCRKKLIDELFQKGSSLFIYPFKVQYLKKQLELQAPAQLLISVPAKIFSRAVDRNRIKRLIREAYRLNKPLLYESLKSTNQNLLIAFIYTSKNIEPFELVNSKIILIIKTLTEINAVVRKNNQ